MTGYRQDIKQGDTVLVWSYREWKERVVKRVTKTQIVIGNDEWESKFRKSDGRRVGTKGYSSDQLKAVTIEELKEHRVRSAEAREIRELRNKVRNEMRELPRYQSMSKEEAQVLLEAVEKIKSIRNKAING